MTYDDTKARDPKAARQRNQQRPGGVVWDWRSVGAIIGLSGGVVSALIGSVLTAFSWFTGAAGVGAYVQTTGTVLLVLMIPMLIFGAHCLDLTEKRKKADRLSRFKE
jgi:amino acid transporter